MKTGVDVVSLTDRVRWDMAHARSGIPSHGWTFNRALTASGMEPVIATVEHDSDTMIVVFYTREWRGYLDICTTLSVSGAIMTRADPVLLDTWRGYAISRGWVAGYLQFEPESRLEGILDAAPGNSVFLVDLDQAFPPDRVSEIIRRKIRRAEAGGVRLVEDRTALARAVIQLYPETMRRAGAGPHYSFSAATLDAWANDPGSLVIGAALESGIEAVGIFPVTGHRAEFHIGASSMAGRDLSAWLIWQAMARLRERGVARLNLGGGTRPGDGLYQFKAKFGGTALPLQAVRQVYRPDVYDKLCREADGSAGWFPAYRSPFRATS